MIIDPARFSTVCLVSFSPRSWNLTDRRSNLAAKPRGLLPKLPLSSDEASHDQSEEQLYGDF
jgi:hypothetical protein